MLKLVAQVVFSSIFLSLLFFSLYFIVLSLQFSFQGWGQKKPHIEKKSKKIREVAFDLLYEKLFYVS